LLGVSEAEFDRVYAVNVKSIYWTAIHMVPYFRQRGGGCFVNIASTAGIRPRPGLTWYNGSKGAVITTSKSMAAELGPDRIRVNCVNPVIGATGLVTEFMGMPDTPENRRKFLATIPLGRYSEPRDVANACLYLASDEAEFITGACIEVDGGAACDALSAGSAGRPTAMPRRVRRLRRRAWVSPGASRRDPRRRETARVSARSRTGDPRSTRHRPARSRPGRAR
jgi:NAD(P)-dependent dehydrogenase (short-subunit alcohol dehydrogenase family)